MISMTTDSVSPHERAEFWADLVSCHVTPMRIEPASEQPLHGEVQADVIGDLGIAQVSGAGAQALHTRAEVARAGDHLYAACVHVAGEARLNRRGEQIALQAGDVFITDSRQEFTLDLDRPWRHLLVTLPTQWLDSRVTRPELLPGAVLRDHPLVRLWGGYLESGFALATELSPAAAALFARHAVELLVQLLEESHRDAQTPSDAWRSAIFLRARRMIALKFGDPNLTPDQIARGLSVSTRTLERVFAVNGQTIMRCVLDERIGRAARMLAAPESAHRSVSDIAFACGFSDASHFGRALAAKMGVVPSRWRRQRQ